jgi:hypothetical protein
MLHLIVNYCLMVMIAIALISAYKFRKKEEINSAIYHMLWAIFILLILLI